MSASVDSSSSSSGRPAFAMDVSLSQVCKYLRLLGLDVLCTEGIGSQRLITLSRMQGRVLITSVGRTVPTLWKMSQNGLAVLLADLSDGRAFASLNREQQLAKQKEEEEAAGQKSSSSSAAVAAAVSADKNDEGQEKKEHDQEQAAVVTDPRKLHSFQDASGCVRKRKLVGYDSDGDSEYEYFDEPVAGAATAAAADGEQQQQQQQVLRWLTIDVQHSPFRATLSRILEVCGIRWSPDYIFTRCLKDGTELKECSKAEAQPHVAAGVFATYDRFYRCKTCARIFFGLDSGVCENYKALRTVQNLRSLFSQEHLAAHEQQQQQQQRKAGNDAQDGDKENASVAAVCSSKTAATDVAASPSSSSGHVAVNRIRMSFTSLPRSVKVGVFELLKEDSLHNLSLAFPRVAGLAERVRLGLDVSFVPERRKNRPNPKFEAWQALDQQQKAAALKAQEKNQKLQQGE